jgi:molecular chaperone Hsp33
MATVTTDRVVRSITDDGAFRVITAMTTETVRGAMAAQQAQGNLARRFGELITGAIIVREAMAPALRVQAILKGKRSKGSLVADSHPDGTSRGLVNFGSKQGELLLGDGVLLQMMRSLPGGTIHQGVIEVPGSASDTANGGVISRALMAYMQDSEQVVSTIAVATVLDGDRVVAAGGYLVQLLPEIERGPLMIMTERLQAFEALEEALSRPDASPDTLMDELLYGFPFTRIETSPLSFACHCSQARVVESLATLPRSDLEDLVSSDEVLEITCDYCRKDFQIPPAQLRPLLTSN